MEKDLIFSELYGLYGSLLTENQRDIFTSYYDCDLSLSEIAEIKNVSRQAVCDSLAKTRELLENYEKNLKLLEKTAKIKKIAAELEHDGIKIAEQIENILGEK